MEDHSTHTPGPPAARTRGASRAVTAASSRPPRGREAAAHPAPGTRLLHDAQGRRITYVRVSLTDRCNFRCRYCMPPEGIHKLTHEEMLSLEELAALIRILVTDLGVEKVRITGGEPLVRRGVIDFVAAVAAIPGLRDLSMTTNGYLLAEMAPALRAAGLQRLNISLDSLQQERFRQITRVDGLAEVLIGIERARETGFSPLKLNTVITRGNLDEAAAIVRYAIGRDIEPRFIELMPSHEDHAAAFVSAAQLRERLAEDFDLAALPAAGCATPPAPSRPADEPPRAAGDEEQCHAAARLYRIDGGPHCVGLIAPVTRPFCHLCNRLRVRGDGHMLPCLSEKRYYDLRPWLRPVLRQRELVAHLQETLATSKGHTPGARRIQGMWRIGG